MVQTSVGTCSKTWVRHPVGDLDMQWRLLGQEYSSLAGNRSLRRNRKIMAPFTFLTQVCYSYVIYQRQPLIDHSEHIKYPESSKPPTQAGNAARKSSIAPQIGGAPQPSPPQNSGIINGERAMSPNSGDLQDPRRAVSPTGPKKLNGITAILPTNGKPKRPRREGDEDFLGTDDGHGTDATTSDSVHRAPSPEQSARAKSPGSTRAISPQMAGDAAQQASIAARLQERTRSPSPIVDRSKPPPDAFYNGVRSPTTNGFANVGSVHGGHGSTGNITADLIRDLKAKEAEMDAMKSREVWMKAALSKASRSGFVYEDRDSGDGDLGLSGDQRKVAELVLNFKQFKAQIQVC